MMERRGGQPTFLSLSVSLSLYPTYQMWQELCEENGTAAMARELSPVPLRGSRGVRRGAKEYTLCLRGGLPDAVVGQGGAKSVMLL